MCHEESYTAGGALAAISEEFAELSFEGRRLSVSSMAPKGAPKGCVVIASDIFGRSSFYRVLARRLAAEGFLAVVPELFSRLWPVAEGDVQGAMTRAKSFDRAEGISDLTCLVEHLKGEYPDLNIGVMGFCIGGALAATLSSKTDLVDANVLYYATLARVPATELAPFIPLDDLTAAKASTFACWGSEDQFVPASVIEDAREALQRSGQNFELEIYPSMGHAFLTFDMADPAYQASRDSWSKSLDFLARHLSPKGAQRAQVVT